MLFRYDLVHYYCKYVPYPLSVVGVARGAGRRYCVCLQRPSGEMRHSRQNNSNRVTKENYYCVVAHIAWRHL